MTSFERFAKLMEDHNVSVLALSRATGVSRNTINGWYARKVLSVVHRENIERVAEFFDVSTSWLIGGNDDIIEEYVFIPEYIFSFGCGLATEPTFEELTGIKPFPFLKSYLRDLAVNPSDCKFVKATSDSMTPFILEDDRVLIECKDVNKIKNGNVYAIVTNVGLSIRQLFVDDLLGDVTVHSYNNLYQDNVIKAKDIESEFLHIYRVLMVERTLVKNLNNNSVK